MKYVTSIERLAIKRGIEQGIEKDRAEGRVEGRTEGSAAVLARLLNRRFCLLPSTVTERLAKATPEQLEIWAERVLDASSLDDVFAGN